MVLRFSILIALALPLLFLFFNKKPPTSPAPAPAESRAGRVPSSPPGSPLPASRPAASPEAGRLLISLRRSYLPSGSKATRFKTQRALDQLWSQAPPIDLILFESLDPSAPPAYRTHFANRLRKIGKVSSPEEKSLLSAKIRQALGSPDHTIATKSILAAPLIAFLDDPENLRAVASLIPDSADDPTSASLLSALSLSKSRLSRTTLENFTTTHANDPDAHRTALRVTLPPLLLDPGSALAPSLRKIITRTSDPDFLRFTTGQLFVRPPSAEILPLVALSLDRAGQLPPAEAEQLKSLISGGLARWIRQADTLSPETVNSLSQIKANLSR